MRSSSTFLSLLAGSLFALVAAACGARSDLRVSSGAGGEPAGGPGGSTSSSSSAATGTGGSPGCNGMLEPRCFDCDNHPIPAECRGATWVCPDAPCLCKPAIWQRTASGNGAQRGTAVAMAPSGKVAFGGSYSGTIGISGPMFYNNEIDVFQHDAAAAMLNPDGTHVWSTAFGAVGDDFVDDVAVDGAESTYLIGTYRSAQILEGFELPGGSLQNLFVVKLTSVGKIAFAKGFAGGANGTQARAALLPNDDLVLAGDTSGTIDFGGGPMPGDNTRDAFVVRLDGNGALVYARRFSGTSHEFATDVAVAPNGDAIVIGTFRETLDFGLGPLTSAGDFDVFVVRLDGAGNVVQSASFGGPGDDRGNSVAVDSAGNTIIEASYSDGADFGSGALSADPMGGVVASYDPMGAPRWVLPFKGPSTVISGGDVFRLAVDDQQNVVLAGQFQGTFDMAGTTLVSNGDYDIVVARLSSLGAVLGACRYGSDNSEAVGGVAVDPSNGEIFLTGEYQGTLDFGLGMMNGDGNGEMYYARLPAIGLE